MKTRGTVLCLGTPGRSPCCGEETPTIVNVYLELALSQTRGIRLICDSSIAQGHAMNDYVRIMYVHMCMNRYMHVYKHKCVCT